MIGTESKGTMLNKILVPGRRDSLGFPLHSAYSLLHSVVALSSLSLTPHPSNLQGKALLTLPSFISSLFFLPADWMPEPLIHLDSKKRF